MPTATVTSKGQITIPKDVREHLGVDAGDRLSFEVQGDGSVLVTPLTRHVRDLAGLLHRPKGPTVSVEAMKEAISRRIRAKFDRHR